MDAPSWQKLKWRSILRSRVVSLFGFVLLGIMLWYTTWWVVLRPLREQANSAIVAALQATSLSVDEKLSHAAIAFSMVDFVSHVGAALVGFLALSLVVILWVIVARCAVPRNR